MQMQNNYFKIKYTLLVECQTVDGRADSPNHQHINTSTVDCQTVDNPSTDRPLDSRQSRCRLSDCPISDIVFFFFLSSYQASSPISFFIYTGVDEWNPVLGPLSVISTTLTWGTVPTQPHTVKVEGKPSLEEKQTTLPVQHPWAPQPGRIPTSGSSGNVPNTWAASLLPVAPLSDFPPLNK